MFFEVFNFLINILHSFVDSHLDNFVDSHPGSMVFQLVVHRDNKKVQLN